MSARVLAPEAADLLRRLREMGARPYPELGVLRARAAVESSRWMQGPKPDGVAVREILVGGASGRLPARVYRPEPRDPDGPAGLVVWFHGGGWVTGSVAAADRPCRAIAAASGCVVVSVEYRLAPENPFPAPVEDCLAATAWLAGHARELGADPERLVVAGDSAGGNLAAAVALLARERGGPVPARQVLVYPALAPPDPDAHPSHRENADGYSLTRADMDWFWEHYLSAHEGPVPAAAAPLLAGDLGGLPPASIAVAGFDPLRDEGLAYGRRLEQGGVGAHVREWPDVIHGFLWMAGELPQSAELVTWLAAECALAGREVAP